MTDPARDVADSQHADSETAGGEVCRPVELPDGSTVLVRSTRELTSEEREAVGALAELVKAKHAAEVGTNAPDDTAPLDAVYRERAHLVAYMAAVNDAVLVEEAPDAPGWSIVYIQVGMWQMSWHIAERDLDLFERVPRVPADDPRALWDGHTTKQKYARLRAHIRVRHMRRAMDSARDVPPDLAAFRVAVTRGERWPVDRLGDGHVDVLYDLIARGDRATWERQAAVIARQEVEIGEMRDRIAYRIRAELVCCDAYDVYGGLDASDDVEPPHAICYWGEAAARIAEGRSDDTPETT